MKTFTLQQAIQVLETYFKGYRIIKKYNSIRELSILFVDCKGQRWELFTSGDSYFQTVEDFVINKMNN